MGLTGVLCVLAGAGLLSAALARCGLGSSWLLSAALWLFPWGAPVEALLDVAAGSVLGRSLFSSPLPGFGALPWLMAGVAAWILGWLLLARVLSNRPDVETASDSPLSEAAGAVLYPRLAQERDFFWGTFLAYGGGILVAEWVLILLHTALVSKLKVPPNWAFTVALLSASATAFAAGFAGTARARRMSLPEATVALVYFGLPVPIFLTAVSAVPALELRFQPLLREILYVAGLVGRPELSVWLAFAALVLMLILGITSGFVATGSGSFDLRLNFELFVARRHVAVFRPRLLLGALAVLLLGILPPLLLYAVLRAAHSAVRRAQIRKLGLVDPLKATAAQHEDRLRQQTPTEMMTALSVGGVGVGVMALIIVLSVMSGFEEDLQKKILGTNAHAVVLNYHPEFDDYAQVMEKLRNVPGVVGRTPFILNEAMIGSESNVGGVIVKGIDPGSVGEVTDLPQNILPGGKLSYLSEPQALQAAGSAGSARKENGAVDGQPDYGDDPVLKVPQKKPVAGASDGGTLPGILVGRELAAALRVTVGDRVNLVSPLGGELGPTGPMPKGRPFRIAGIFYSGMYEYDSKFTYVLLDEARSFFNVRGATGIELKVADIDDARRISEQVVKTLGGYPYRAKDWGEMNRNLFSALRL